jgi:hypothetical protein
MKNKTIAFIIPVHSSEYLVDLLFSINKQNNDQIHCYFYIDKINNFAIKTIQKKLNKKHYTIKTGKKLNTCEARNFLLSICQEPYAILIDDDDILSPQLSTSMLQVINSNKNIVAIHGGMQFFCNKTKIDHYPITCKLWNDLPIDIFNISQPFLFKTAMLTKLKGDPGLFNLGDDVYLYSNIVSVEKMHLLKEILYYKRLHKNNQSNSFSNPLMTEHIKYCYQRIIKKKTLDIKIKKIKLIYKTFSLKYEYPSYTVTFTKDNKDYTFQSKICYMNYKQINLTKKLKAFLKNKKHANI